MAMTSTAPWYNNHERRGSSGDGGKVTAAAGGRRAHQQQQHEHPSSPSGDPSGDGGGDGGDDGTSVVCPPSSFPDKFQDFFATLNEDLDDLPSMLEDKLIPRKQSDCSRLMDVFGGGGGLGNNNNNKNNHNNGAANNNNNGFLVGKQRWPKRAFQRRSSEIEVRLHSAAGHGGHPGSEGGPKSPNPSRRRSSSIAVARPTPDLHRFLQAEAGPWGHLSPSPRSPTRALPSLSPGPASAASSQQHLTAMGTTGTTTGTTTTTTTSAGAAASSPGSGPSPTSPGAPSPSGAAAVSGAVSRLPPQSKHRGRTSSMPAVPRHKPMLADTRRCVGGGNNGGGGGGGPDDDTEDGVEYYRVRSFSITANGVFNLGDALKSRRSRSINSVTSSGTSCSSTREARLMSSASQISGIETGLDSDPITTPTTTTTTTSSTNNTTNILGGGGGGGTTSARGVPTYKVGMLGASGVGKTALTAQFTTSEYICAYDASLDDEYGQKSVSVMIDGQETELEIIDHPSTEMSVETFCSTYNPDVYVVVYSVVDRRSLKFAEETLLHLWKSDYMAGHGVILVGNKVDLERKREVPAMMGRRLASSCDCKFIETSSGLAHHVDELLVGVLAQIKLNPQRDREQTTRRRRSSKHSRRRILKHLLGFKRKTKSCENLFVL